MTENIFVPTKCKVGFNTREDTFTGKLGFIIYMKGKDWKQEPSWENWREKELNEQIKQEDLDRYNRNRTDNLIYDYEELSYYYKTKAGIGVEPIEFDNVPTEGFVLNKKVGGTKSGWNHRSTYCRVYDPRGFEFEISIPNLLYILDNATSTVGKGLEGKFIYGWQGKDLVLIPEKAPEFKEMLNFTSLQSKSVKAKELIKGATYLTKQKEQLVYLGKFDYYDYDYDRITYAYNPINKGKKHWFIDNNKRITTTVSLNLLGEVLDDNCVSNYSELLDYIETLSIYSPFDESKYVYELVTGEIRPNSNNWYNKEGSSYKGVYFIKDNKEVYCSIDTQSAECKYNEDKKYLENQKSGWGGIGLYARDYQRRIDDLKLENYKQYFILSDGQKLFVPLDKKPFNYLLENNLLYKQIKYLQNGKKAN